MASLPVLLTGDGGRLTSYFVDEFGDDEPLVAEDVGAVTGVLHVGDFGEPAAAGLGDPHGEVLGDDDVAVLEVSHNFGLSSDIQLIR